MNKIILAAATSAALLSLAGSTAFAQQGTTLAGPAQGSKANGSSSMQPSAASGANGTANSESGMSGASGTSTEGGAMSTGGATSGAATAR